LILSQVYIASGLAPAPLMLLNLGTQRHRYRIRPVL
jgi:hypothetical protein